jgi:hypothetical protein
MAHYSVLVIAHDEIDKLADDLSLGGGNYGSCT